MLSWTFVVELKECDSRRLKFSSLCPFFARELELTRRVVFFFGREFAKLEIGSLKFLEAFRRFEIAFCRIVRSRWREFVLDRETVHSVSRGLENSGNWKFTRDFGIRVDGSVFRYLPSKSNRSSSLDLGILFRTWKFGGENYTPFRSELVSKKSELTDDGKLV